MSLKRLDLEPVLAIGCLSLIGGLVLDGRTGVFLTVFGLLIFVSVLLYVFIKPRRVK